MISQKFTPKAMKLWRKVPAWAQEKLLANVYCRKCATVTTIVDFSGKVVDGELVLSGFCQLCGSEVTRLIESQ
jgi:hypothetical protein